MTNGRASDVSTQTGCQGACQEVLGRPPYFRLTEDFEKFKRRDSAGQAYGQEFMPKPAQMTGGLAGDLRHHAVSNSGYPMVCSPEELKKQPPELNMQTLNELQSHKTLISSNT